MYSSFLVSSWLIRVVCFLPGACQGQRHTFCRHCADCLARWSADESGRTGTGWPIVPTRADGWSGAGCAQGRLTAWPCPSVATASARGGGCSERLGRRRRGRDGILSLTPVRLSEGSHVDVNILIKLYLFSRHDHRICLQHDVSMYHALLARSTWVTRGFHYQGIATVLHMTNLRRQHLGPGQTNMLWYRDLRQKQGLYASEYHHSSLAPQ